MPVSAALETIEIAMSGKTISHFYDRERKYPLVLRLDERTRNDIDTLKKLPVPVPPGSTINLSQVSEVELKDAYSVIKRENGKRRVAVLINPRGSDVESFVKSAQKLIEKDIKLPEGYYLEWGGKFENLIKAKERLSIAAPIALMIIVFMLYSALGTLSETLLVLTCVPLALVGGVFGLVVNNLNFSISAGVGLIALSGIAVLNGLVLIQFFKQKRAEGLSGSKMVKDGSMARLRPVLMTAITDILGFLPMMLATGAGAEVQSPIAAVIVGGVFTSTCLTLIVLPVIYNFLEKRGLMSA